MRNYLIVVLVLIIGGGLVYYFGFYKKENKVEQTNLITEQPGLKIEILKEGTGKQIQNSETAVVNYSGKLEDGTEFDSSYKRGVPFSFVLGSGMVIKGWELGVLGMKIGEKRKLTIAPELAYGDTGAGGGVIPPKATLIFEVELLEIK